MDDRGMMWCVLEEGIPSPDKRPGREKWRCLSRHHAPDPHEVEVVRAFLLHNIPRLARPQTTAFRHTHALAIVLGPLVTVIADGSVISRRPLLPRRRHHDARSLWCRDHGPRHRSLPVVTTVSSCKPHPCYAVAFLVAVAYSSVAAVATTGAVAAFAGARGIGVRVATARAGGRGAVLTLTLRSGGCSAAGEGALDLRDVLPREWKQCLKVYVFVFSAEFHRAGQSNVFAFRSCYLFVLFVLLDLLSSPSGTLATKNGISGET